MFQIAFIIFIIIGAIIHEYSHAWAADELGDPTARHAGRLTLNPLAHIDLFGTVILPLLMIFTFGAAFGYAKPVPYNPYNLKDRKWGPALVAIAGPLSNLIIAIVLTFFVRFLPQSQFVALLGVGIYANVLLLVFNLIPIPPLDGSKILLALLPDSAWKFKQNLEHYGAFILLFIIFFAYRVIIAPIIIWTLILLIGTENLMFIFNSF